MRQSQFARGFTLIEVMITVAIIAILSSIALPSYRNYVLRGKLVNATSALSSTRAQMEQYYQDYRTYAATGSVKPPCSTSQTIANEWTVVCSTAPSSTAYTITATGSGAVAGFTFAIDQTGTPTTTSVPASWGTAGTDLCWYSRPGPTC